MNSLTPSVSPLRQRMIDDMDINCGDVLDGVTIEAKGREIFDKIVAVASGETTKSEDLGYGDNEFVPWQQILVYLEAIVRVYNRYGRRDNLYKARIKILVKAEGQKFFDA
eukprot:gene43923-58555_t